MKKLLIFIAFIAFLGLLIPHNASGADDFKYNIYIRYGFNGFEKLVFTKLSDFFHINYPGDPMTHDILYFQKGRLIQHKDKTGRLFYIEEVSKHSGKNEWTMVIRPYVTPDPRSIYPKK